MKNLNQQLAERCSKVAFNQGYRLRVPEVLKTPIPFNGGLIIMACAHDCILQVPAPDGVRFFNEAIYYNDLQDSVLQNILSAL